MLGLKGNSFLSAPHPYPEKGGFSSSVEGENGVWRPGFQSRNRGQKVRQVGTEVGVICKAPPQEPLSTMLAGPQGGCCSAHIFSGGLFPGSWVSPAPTPWMSLAAEEREAGYGSHREHHSPADHVDMKVMWRSWVQEAGSIRASRTGFQIPDNRKIILIKA